MVSLEILQNEMARADEVLLGLAGEAVDTLTVKSLSADDAPFLGQIVSKLSPMIGNLLEQRIIQILDQNADVSGHGMHWRRQDPGFPDAILVDSVRRKYKRWIRSQSLVCPIDRADRSLPRVPKLAPASQRATCSCCMVYVTPSLWSPPNP